MLESRKIFLSEFHLANQLSVFCEDALTVLSLICPRHRLEIPDTLLSRKARRHIESVFSFFHLNPIDRPKSLIG